MSSPRRTISIAGQHRAGELRAVYPGGDFVYGAEAAARWLDLVESWKTETGNNSVSLVC